MQLPPPSGLVTLLTDFGLRDPYVGIMKGVIKARCARADIVDLCHEVPPQSVELGGMFVGEGARHFPAGTVHVAVVDPGVGTARRALAVCSAGSYWIAPDNGLLTAVLDAHPAEVRALDIDKLGLHPRSRTFHGRDVFAPAAAMLAGRRYGFRALGNRVQDAVTLAAIIDPPDAVIAIDHFGNLITGVRADRVTDVSAVEVAGCRIPIRGTYQDAPAGELLALVNSYDLLEIAVNGGSAAAALGVGRDEKVRLVEEASTS